VKEAPTAPPPSCSSAPRSSCRGNESRVRVSLDAKAGGVHWRVSSRVSQQEDERTRGCHAVTLTTEAGGSPAEPRSVRDVRRQAQAARDSSAACACRLAPRTDPRVARVRQPYHACSSCFSCPLVLLPSSLSPVQGTEGSVTVAVAEASPYGFTVTLVISTGVSGTSSWPSARPVGVEAILSTTSMPSSTRPNTA
jgi:hypothetical protein